MRLPAQVRFIARGWLNSNVLSADGLTLNVLHTPGHSPGGIALHCPELNALFAGDAVWQGDLGAVNVAIHGGRRSFTRLPRSINWRR